MEKLFSCDRLGGRVKRNFLKPDSGFIQVSGLFGKRLNMKGEAKDRAPPEVNLNMPATVYGIKALQFGFKVFRHSFVNNPANRVNGCLLADQTVSPLLVT